MFKPVESSVSFPQLEESISSFGRSGESTKNRSPPGRAPRHSSSTRARRRPTACPIRAIASPGPSRTCFPATKPCGDISANARRAGTPTGCRSKSRSAKSWASTPRRRSRLSASSRSSTSCLESVFRYTQQWEELTKRLGFWIHLDEAYVTFHQSYVESVWWALKNLFDRGLLYQGHKIVWWWAQGGTALSSAKWARAIAKWPTRAFTSAFPLVRSGSRREMGRIARYRCWFGPPRPGRCPAINSPRSNPIWNIGRRAVEGQPRKLILASALVEAIAKKVGSELTVEATLPGEKLIGLALRAAIRLLLQDAGRCREGRLPRPAAKQHLAWRVVPADFVTIDTVPGIVHQAPAFGEVDFDVLQSEQARFAEGEGPRPDLRRRPRRHIHRRNARLPGPLGQRLRPRHHPPTEGRGTALPSRAVPPRLPVLLAGGRRPADPISAQELVHPHHRLQGEDAGQQQPHQLAAGAHPRRAVRQFSGDQRRLGPLARALLGHAAADLGVREDRATWRPSAATPSCWPSRASPASRSGRRRRRKIPSCPTI